MLCKIWGFQGGDYEECRLLGYRKPVPTSQETRYISTTEPDQLMLCKIWGFHGGDYDECRLLGYRNPVRTSQETLHLWYGGDYEECRLLGCDGATSQKTTFFKEKTNSVALSPRANYTDWTTATCWRNSVPTFVDRWVSPGQRGGSPTVVILSFLDRSRYFSFK
jgi:hypothetical protein